jgi:hypothetical protein
VEVVVEEEEEVVAVAFDPPETVLYLELLKTLLLAWRTDTDP